MDKSISKNIGKNIGRKLSSKYSQKLLDHTKQSAAYAIKTTFKRLIQKTAEATGDLIGSKTAEKITKVTKTLQQNNSETVTNEPNKEIRKERYMCYIINVLHKTPNQPSKFSTKNWVEINDNSLRTYNSQIKFETSLFKMACVINLKLVFTD